MTTPTQGPGEAPDLEQLAAFLATAPPELQGWAEQQLELARRGAPGGAESVDAGQQAVPAPVAEDFDLLGLEDEAEAARPAAVAAHGAGRRSLRQNKLLRPLALAALTALLVFGVYSMGQRPDATGPNAANPASAASAPVSTPKPVDPQMVATLEKKVEQDPKDTLSMKALGEIYSQAEQYPKAAQWQERVVKVEPKDVDAHLALGVAYFNDAKLEQAEKAWTTASRLAPERATIWYNLGFLYLSTNEIPKAQQAWQKVVDIDPNSDLAKTVSAHLTSMKQATASPQPSGAKSPTTASSSATTPGAAASSPR